MDTLDALAAQEKKKQGSCMSAFVPRNGVWTWLADGLDTILSHWTWDVAALLFLLALSDILFSLSLLGAGLDFCWFRYPMLVISETKVFSN
jgi:hypothetical protein